MTGSLDTALDDVLSRLQQGEPLAACLGRWPRYAEELRPLTETAGACRHALSRVEPPSEQAMARLRAEYGRQLDRHLALSWWQRLGWARPAMRAVAALAAVVLFLSMLAAGAVAISADALPGDTLYPVKRLGEDARLWFAWNTNTRTRLESEFSRERIQEVQAVLTSRRQTVVEFEGRLESMDGTTWLVAGVRVTVAAGTAIDGRLQLRNEVSVRARALGDGTLEAIRIQLRQGPPAVDPTPTAAGVPSGTPMGTRNPTATLEPTALPTNRPRATGRPAGHPAGGPHPTALPTTGPKPTAQPTFSPHPTGQSTGGPPPTTEPTGGPGPTAHPTGGPHPTGQPTGSPHPTAQPTGGSRPADQGYSGH